MTCCSYLFYLVVVLQMYGATTHAGPKPMHLLTCRGCCLSRGHATGLGWRMVACPLHHTDAAGSMAGCEATCAVCMPQCQPWFVVWLRPRAAAVHTLDAVFSSDDSHRLELLLSLLGRCARGRRGPFTHLSAATSAAATLTVMTSRRPPYGGARGMASH